MSGIGYSKKKGIQFALSPHGFLLYPRSSEYTDGEYIDFNPKRFGQLAYRKTNTGYEFRFSLSKKESGNQFFFEKKKNEDTGEYKLTGDVYSWWGSYNGDGPFFTRSLYNADRQGSPIYKNGKALPIISYGSVVLGFYTASIDGARYYYMAGGDYLTGIYTDSGNKVTLYVIRMDYNEEEQKYDQTIVHEKLIWPINEEYWRKPSALWPVRFNESGTEFAMLDIGASEVGINRDVMYLVKGSISIENGINITSVDQYGPITAYSSKSGSYRVSDNADAYAVRTIIRSYLLSHTINYVGNSEYPIALNYSGDSLFIKTHIFDYATYSYEISGSATIESYQELLQDGRTVWHMNKSGSLGNGSASYNYTSHATVFDTGTYIYSIDESYSDTGNSGYGRSDSIAYIDVARDIEFRFKNFKEVNSSSSYSYSFDLDAEITHTLNENYSYSVTTDTSEETYYNCVSLGLSESLTHSGTSGDGFSVAFNQNQETQANEFWYANTNHVRFSTGDSGVITPWWQSYTLSSKLLNSQISAHLCLFRGFNANKRFYNTSYSEFSDTDTERSYSETEESSYKVECPVLTLFGITTNNSDLATYLNGSMPLVSYVYDERCDHYCTTTSWVSNSVSSNNSKLIINKTYSSFGATIYKVDENGNVLKDINNNPISYEIPQIALQTTEDITRLETSVVIKNKLEDFQSNFPGFIDQYEMTLSYIGLF